MSVEQIKRTLLGAREALDALLRNEQALRNIEEAAQWMVASLEAGGRIFSCGNGGSMSDAMHFAAELTGRYRKDRRGVAAVAISDSAHISCVANDFGYDQIFSRYVEGHGRKGDVLLAISTSGRSPNVINAVKSARAVGMKSVALTGRANSAVEALADVCICSEAGPFADRIQELHIKVIHVLVELIERRIFPEHY